MNTITTPRVDADLEAKHRTLWGLGDYAAIATDLVAPLGPVLVTAAGISPDQRVLDVAAGTGNTALAAASVGADRVTRGEVFKDDALGADRRIEDRIDPNGSRRVVDALPAE